MKCDCLNVPVPKMYVRKTLTLARRSWFLSHKHAALSHKIGQIDTVEIQYSTDVFTNFLMTKVINKPGINYLRIYLTSFQHRLGVVYATNNPADPMNELFYIVSQTDFFSIDKISALALHNEFIFCKLPILNTHVPKPSHDDTRSVTYKVEDIKGLWDEIYCQKPDGLKLCFCSYLNGEYFFNDDGELIDLSNLLHLSFVFTKMGEDNQLYDFFIDDCDSFLLRPGAPLNKEELATSDFKTVTHDLMVSGKIGILKPDGFDNGSLCPPCTGCSGVLVKPAECANKKS